MASMLVRQKNQTLLGGWTESDDGADITEPNRGWSDYWIILIDRHGNKIWDKRFGGDHDDHMIAMAPTPATAAICWADLPSQVPVGMCPNPVRG